jgi:hypothetical protein
MLIRPRTLTANRRGVILLVVLALLTLFAIVGISFVYYADSAANSARINREAEQFSRPDVDPELALALFLGQMLYDAPDDENGVYSALRGHSLARSMYGFYYDPSSTTPAPNDKPYNGTGKLNYASPLASDPTVTTVAAKNDAFLINFSYFRDLEIAAKNTPFIRDPERLSTRSNNPTSNALDPNYLTGRGTYTGGFNVPYTYPDHNNIFLGMLQASTGKVLMPSFHRPWLFGSLAANPSNPNYTSATWNQNWLNREGRYLILRPRPIDNQVAGKSTFPYPESDGGDVQNFDGGVGGNDSIWIDINAPVMIAPDGTKYKMMVAPLILELDSHLNLNVAGNILANGDHASNMGWGPWEMNISKVLTNGTEWQNLFNGTQTAGQPHVVGRYGYAYQPRRPVGVAVPGGVGARGWAPVDFNGTQDPAPNVLTAQLQLPSPTNANTVTYQCFPWFPQPSNSGNGYGDGVPLETTDSANNPNHPLIYNYFNPGGYGTSTTYNRTLPVSGMAALLRAGGTNSEVLTSDIMRLCPTNFANLKTRNLATLLSMDLDRTGATPYIWDPADSTTTPTPRYQYTGATGLTFPAPVPYPTANPVTFPALTTRATAPPANSEFDTNTWRGVLAQLSRVDLNRIKTTFPAPDPTTGIINMTTNGTQFNNALTERQNLAQDIFNLLVKITGSQDPTSLTNNKTLYTNITVAVASSEYQALRWLAQLSVNIVDYIDQDDYITPFNWFNYTDANGNAVAEWVYGTELPRLVMNEDYIQIDNDPKDTSPLATVYNVNTWLELHNPFISDKVGGANGTQDNQARLHTGTYAIYRILFAKNNEGLPTVPPMSQTLRNPANTLGDPEFQNTSGIPNTLKTVNDWGMAGTVGGAKAGDAVLTVLQNDNKYAEPNAPSAANKWTQPANTVLNNGFYVVGPHSNFVANADPKLTVTYASPNMTYQVNVGDPTTTWRPTILLQRLACPALPPNPPPGGVLDTTMPYNPYITTDYLEHTLDAQRNDGRLFDGTMGLTPPAMNLRTSWGRFQPYTAIVAQRFAQNPNPAPQDSTGFLQPLHTFYRHNGVEGAPPLASNAAQTLKIPFDWLVQLDRQLISPIELMHVSAYKPHELTQQFIQGAPGLATETQFQHLAPWTNETTRLYRFFEFVQTKSRMTGVAMGGRVPGKININMVFDQEIFNAMCDAQSANLFNQPMDVTTVFNALIAQRSPNYSGSSAIGPTDATLAAGAGYAKPDRPIWSLAMGPSPGGDALDPASIFNSTSPAARGINNTLLQKNLSMTTGQMLFDPTAAPNNPATVQPPNPYQRLQLLTKIYNNITTRSNVFAVWLTVGFFEVTDDTTRPVKLGAEIGRSEGRHVRHRMFAIVDRTNLNVFSSTSSLPPNPPAGTTMIGPGSATFVLGNGQQANFTDSRTGIAWTPQQGSVLVFDPNTTSEETVVIQSVATQTVGGNTYYVYQANFNLAHNTPGGSVLCRGNPGPWKRYDPRKDTGVVQYFSIID